MYDTIITFMRKRMNPIKNLIICVLGALAASVSFAAVDINTASEGELTALPGVGPAKARAIVEYRKQHGRFKRVDELKNVKGIGEGIFAKLKDEAVVTAPVKKAAQPAVKK